jgi:hypothetical protein
MFGAFGKISNQKPEGSPLEQMTTSYIRRKHTNPLPAKSIINPHSLPSLEMLDTAD